MANNKNLVQLIIGAKDEASKVLSGVTSSLGKVVAAASAAAAAVSSYFGAKLFIGGIKSAEDFELSMARIKAATNASTDEMAALTKAAQDAGRSTIFTASEAANGLEILGKAGVSAANSIKALPTLLALAEGQSIDMNTAAGLLTDTINQMGMSFDQAGTVADVLAKGANLANTTVTDLGAAMSYAGAASHNAGLTLQQTVAILDQLASSGLRGERAGTGLQQILVMLSNPASQARIELAKLGDTSSSLGDAIDTIKKAGDAATPAINAFGQSAIPAVRALANGGVDAVNQFATQLDNAGGAAKGASNIISDTLDRAIKGLGSSWDAMSQYLAQPLLKPIADGARDLTKAINDAVSNGKLDTLRKTLVDVFKQGTDAVKEFLANFKVDDAVTSVNDKIKSLSESFSKVKNAGNTAANVLTGSWNLFRAGVDAVGIAITSVLAGVLDLATAGVQVFNSIGIASDDLVKKINTMREGVYAVGDAYAKDLVESGQKATEAFAKLGSSADSASEKIKNAAKDAADAADQINAISPAALANADAMAKLGLNWDNLTQSFVAGKTEAQKTQEVLDHFEQSLNKASSGSKKFGDSNSELSSTLTKLYSDLGLVNKAAAETKLDQNVADLEKLRNAGAITAAEYYRLKEAIDAKRAALENDSSATDQAVANNHRLGKSASDAARDYNPLSNAIMDVNGNLAGLTTPFDTAEKSAQAVAESLNSMAGGFTSASAAAQNFELQGISSYSASLGKATQAAISTSDGLYAMTQRIKGLNSVAGADGPMGKLSDQLKQVQGDAATAQHDILSLREATVSYSASIGYDKFTGFLQALAEQKQKLAASREEALQFQIAMQGISDAATGGTLSLEAQLQQLTSLKSKYRDLDQSSLQALQGQIDQVSSSLKSMSDAADQTLANLQSQLAQAQGKLAEQATIDAQQKVLDLQNKINAAKAAGNEKAVADLQQALQVQQQINEINIKNAKAQENAAKTGTSTATTSSSSTTQTTQAVKTIRLDLGNGNGFDVPASQEAQLMAFINSLSTSKKVAS